MPELPEIETTCRGIGPAMLAQPVRRVLVRNAGLRWPVPADLDGILAGRRARAIGRRGKYILVRFDHGHLILHLGMSGSLRIVPAAAPPGAHDHVDFELEAGHSIRLRDPRRFGSIHWTCEDPHRHRLLAGLGPEPLLEGFDGGYLYRASRGRSQAVKTFIMDSRIVVGIGNIYASEALFRAGIHPARPAGRISAARYDALARAARAVLEEAIRQGGTTLRDFVNSEGQPGYFKQTLNVYDRAGEPCRRCGVSIRHRQLGQRSTYYCSRCQT